VFKTTENVSAFTKAALFQKCAATEMLAHFSTVAGEAGSPDTWREVPWAKVDFLRGSRFPRFTMMMMCHPNHGHERISPEG